MYMFEDFLALSILEDFAFYIIFHVKNHNSTPSQSFGDN